mgnify:CR=1 FL=1
MRRKLHLSILNMGNTIKALIFGSFVTEDGGDQFVSESGDVFIKEED